MSPTSPVTDPQLAETAAALAKWRNTCPRSARIPDALWSQATELAQRHGVAPVAVALKLDYKSLKRRLTTGSTTGDAPCTPASPDFVELDLGLSATPAMCVLVLTDGAGRALRIALPQASAGDVAALARSLWQVPACSR